MNEPTNPSGAQTEILIVEDSPVEAEMLRRILVRAGYRVTVAKNGEEGLQALREHPSALVISDIRMPLMNGYELCHAIKLDEKLWHTPVILVTALSEPKDIIKALDAGADGYITKPYIEDILLGRIRSLLANPARRKLADERRRIQLEYGGEQHSVAVDSPQMANLLLSVYENSLTLNQELMHIQNQLNLLNDTLEEKIRERTAALRESEEKFRVIFEGGLDGILLADAETRRFAGGNPAICRMLDYSFEEIMQLGVADIHPQQALPHVVEQFEKQLRGEIQLAADIPMKRKDGSVFYADIKSSPVSFGGKNYLLGIFRDITARRQAEAQLKNSEERHRQIVQTSMDGFWITDTKKGRILDVNDAYCQMTGYAREELLNMRIPDVEAKETPEETAQHIREIMTKGHVRFETRHRRKDGQLLDIEASVVHRPDPEDGHFFVFLRDITERKQAEEELRLRAQLLDSASDTIFVVDFNGNFVYLNEAAWKTRGYTRDEMMGLNLHVLDTPKCENLIESRMRDLMENGQCIFESEHRRKDGSVMPVEINAHTIESGSRKLVLSVIRDITERKQAEAKILAAEAELQRLLDAANQSRRALLSVIQDQKRAEIATQHANRALSTLSAANRNLVHATDENELLQAICQAIVEQKGYRLAWVGYVQHDENKSIKIMAHAGQDEGYLDTMQLTWAETERGMGSSGRAIRSGATQLCQDIANDPLYLPWRDAALKRGYLANIALPLLNGDNAVFGILNVYAAEANAFTSTEIDLLEEMAGDMAFGVLTLHTRHERDLALVKNQQQLVQLQDSLEDTVRAMAAIVEMRDPYTAGHQVRVADLSVAIAKQMALPEEQIHAIHLAGIVHDLGKIRIPAEILSKPGKITDLEFGLIKTHAQAGYDILKDINFPWPIAQMVLQHHERLDGSGYPQGLKGEAILLEARILSVADVVEAMSSHRPYRPGLGNDAAMEEITKNRGKFYDPQVVDACLALFREQHYAFQE